KVGRLLQISTPISMGSSGSPVLNMKGEVVGIVTFSLLEGQNLNFAIPAQYLLDLKPSETLKTISEWNGQDVCRLYVHTEPEGAKVRILNINPKFFQGIVLKPGRYHIEVSSDGYKTEKTWIRIGPGQDKDLRISLEKNLHVLSEEQILTKTSVFFSKGIEHEFKGEYREAIDAYKECIRIDPNSRLCHMGMGEAYIRIEHYREAIDAFKECIRIDPYVPAFHFYIGRCYFSLGLRGQAIDECKLAIQYKPDDEMACKTYILLGGSYGQIGHFTEAIEAFKKAIQIKPDDAFAHFSIGVAYLAHGDRSSALDQYKILKDLDKEQAYKLFNIIYK
ncbi:tetratricopeptide repeat protein, partial [bacterium]|nr:tetratricopeptide repeat protein [bacterium]